jgi:hypothetical protein
MGGGDGSRSLIAKTLRISGTNAPSKRCGPTKQMPSLLLRTLGGLIVYRCRIRSPRSRSWCRAKERSADPVRCLSGTNDAAAQPQNVGDAALSSPRRGGCTRGAVGCEAGLVQICTRSES